MQTRRERPEPRSGSDDAQTAVVLADRIVSVLQQPIVVGDLRIQLTVSVGVAFAGRESSPETLLSEADAAMYEVKRSGRNAVAMAFEGPAPT